ncbi:MAG: DUF1059 domain-containing protein [Actinobacteria bacterium]|nr:DUF1059 domain-containing protein [Actinomycetota bacterium]
MSYEFRCEDAGAACGAKVTADDPDELERQVAAHLEEKHDVQHVTKTLRKYVHSVAKER